MKKTSLHKTSTMVISCMATIATLTIQSCNTNVEIPERQILTQKIDTTVLLVPSLKESPTCHIVMDLKYVHSDAANDHVADTINQTITKIALGDQHAGATPETAMKNAIENYVTNYRQGLSKAYIAALEEGEEQEAQSPIYRYEYDLKAELSIVRDSIYSCSVTDYQFRGGAHPMTLLHWANINARTGKIMTKEDLYKNNSEQEIISLISRHLVTELNQRMQTDTLTTLHQFQEQHVLFATDLFVPDNFLLTEQGITFLYNRYEIAPYALGDIQITIPYEEIENPEHH